LSIANEKVINPSNFSILYAIITSILIFVYILGELKYREYRWKYIKVYINAIDKSQISNPNYKELFNWIQSRTEFPSMPLKKVILELFPPEDEVKYWFNP
jgi:hypothetical protein